MTSLERTLVGTAPAAGTAAAAAPARAKARDLRIDFFRGLALLIIFIDHIPENVFALITLRNFGFCDAAEIFIFLSGYSAGYVFQLRERRQGFAFASFETVRRVWTLYVVHIFVFVLFVAQVSFTAAKFGNPMYLEEMNMTHFLQEPHVAVMEALLLRFQPRFLDILPLYIVLLAVLTPLMALAKRAAWPCLIVSGALWLGVQLFGWHFTAYPDAREWTFNPLAWQFLFVIGAFAGRAVINGGSPVPAASRWLMPPAVIYLTFAFVIGLSWTVSGVYPTFPGFLSTTLWPLDKTDLSPWRLAHFLALAYVVAMVTRGRMFDSRLARPIVIVGQHGLHTFCLGIFLSVFGDIVLQEISRSFTAQVVVNLVGCGLMIGLAALLNWYKSLTRGPGGPQGGPMPKAAG